MDSGGIGTFRKTDISLRECGVELNMVQERRSKFNKHACASENT